MAIVPPPNASGIPPPPNPVDPVTYEDIAAARKYLEDLSWTQANPAHQTPATADVVGKAEAYRSSLVFAVDQGPAAPAWLQDLTASINAIRVDVTAMRGNINTMQANINTLQADFTTMQANFNAMQGDVAQLLQRSDEQPVLLANSRAGTREPLYDPTQLQGNWAAPLVRPQHRDDLLTMSAQDCITAATALGLPPLPAAGTTVVDRRRQIARRIGVRID
ncbi:hypothetical protein NLJ89_g575 [Agrocybe chaxingu]|uniref:Uncharacterized protein n=1 Tax=Agrocybe chaxingu TaxID=84603 RepID=A0A9W8N1M3_9AGAR|nr:hypothetical protein NLJ89_g575 [Agrocybe chaxingu]